MKQKRCAELQISSSQSSNALNNTGVCSLIELASLYTVPLSAVNRLSRLTATSNGQSRPIRKFSNRPITFESEQPIRIGSQSFAGPYILVQKSSFYSERFQIYRV